MSVLADFHFLRPLALLLLLALPLFWLAWRAARGDGGAWRAAVDAHLLPHLIERIDLGPGRGGLVLAAVLWSLACVALAGPAWQREAMPLYHNQAARVMALELDTSMLAQDEKPSRLARARYKIDDILQRSRDYQTALIGYAGAAFVAAPLTDDTATVKNLVDALDPSTMPVAGNATGAAINAAVALIEQAGVRRGEIILIADSVDDDAVAAARGAAQKGLVVSVLGVGSSTGAPVPLSGGGFLKDEQGNVIVSKQDVAGLRAVAAAGGGHYAELAADASDLDLLLADNVDAAGKGSDSAVGTNGAAATETARWRDSGIWFVLALLPLALLGFRRGWLMLLALALLAPMPPARAVSLTDLWQRPDQQASAALAKGDAKQAAAVARAPDWRGTAEYRAGDYAAAAGNYAKSAGANGAYNRGNALAKLGRYEEAIAAYDDALKLSPDMADATANKNAVEDFLKQSKDQQSKDQQSGKKQSGDQNSKDQQSKNSQSKDQQSKDQQSRDQQSQDQQSQDQQSKDQQSKDQQSQDQQSKDQQSKDQQSQKDQDESKSGDQDNKSSGKGDKPASDSATDQQQSAQSSQAPDKEQQQALSQSIDKALAKSPETADKDAKAKAAVAQEDAAQSEKQQALEHWLRRVPDDPGGLLRRKFQLEYQRRQQRGGDQG